MMFKSRLLKAAIVAVAAGVLIFFGSARAAGPWRASAFRAVAPLLAGARSAAAGLSGWVGGISGRRVGALEAERVLLLARIAELQAMGQENATLRATLTLRSAGEAGALPAQAIAVVREGRDEYLILNRGTADGIGIGDIVVNQARVLGGTVVGVDLHTARAILASSPSRSIDVFIPSSNLRAIARGNNSREFIVDLVAPDAPIAVGDLIVASPRATGGRRTLLVGEIREVRQAEHEVFKTVRAVHLFDPADPAVIVLLAP